MKLLVGILCAVLFTVVGTTTDAHAYLLTNSTSAPVNGIQIRTSCGIFGVFNLPPGPSSINVPIPTSCNVGGILYSGMFFPVGYSGPVPPPNPPNGVTVTSTGATFW